MAVLLRFLILMAMKTAMKTAMASDAAEVVSAHSRGAALLMSRLRTLQRRQDVRWTHPHLVMSLRNNVTACHHGRCRLLSDGSLSFSRVQSEDAGTYSLEVFDEDGRRLLRRDVLLTVDDLSSSSSSMSVSVLLVLFVLLLLVFIIIFIVRRRRSQRARTAGPLEQNVYVTMHGHRGNKRKDEDKEESQYVPCNPVVSMETPITERLSVDVEDIYV